MPKWAYYNENDAKKAAVIRELIRRGVVCNGEVDERSIADVKPDDLTGFRQCHFFAGFAVWSYALRLAGWPDDRECWTGSCPCPSFSCAGKGEGFNDPRHLWPDWFRLIRQCLPATVFGEQVAASIGHGWLDLVQTDLETENYAVGKAVLGACSVGAPHIRQRLYFGADAASPRQARAEIGSAAGSDALEGPCSIELKRDRDAGRRAHTEQRRLQQSDAGEREFPELYQDGELGGSQHAESGGFGIHGSAPGEPKHALFANETNNGNFSLSTRLEGHAGDVGEWRGPGWLPPDEARSIAETGATRGFWANCDWWHGKDGKYRPSGSGIFPLAHGTTARVLRLRGYGDAIVPEVAAQFIEVILEAMREKGGCNGLPAVLYSV